MAPPRLSASAPPYAPKALGVSAGGVGKAPKRATQWVRGQAPPAADAPTPEALEAEKRKHEEALAALAKRRADAAAALAKKKEVIARKKEEVAQKKQTKTWKRADDTKERLQETEAKRAALVERIKMETARQRADQIAEAERRRAEEEAEEAKRKQRQANLVKGFAAAGATDTAAERLARWRRRRWLTTSTTRCCAISQRRWRRPGRKGCTAAPTTRTRWWT